MIEHDYDTKEHLLSLTFGTDLLSTNVEQLDTAARAVFARDDVRMSQWRTLVLDFSSVRMIDSMGINFLIQLLRVADGRKAKVKGIITRHNLHRLFLFTRLDKKIELDVRIPPEPAAASPVS